MNQSSDTTTRIVILSDFDDTAAEQNVAALLMEKFTPMNAAGGIIDWRDMHAKFINKKLSLKFYQETAFAMLHNSISDQTNYVSEYASFRTGFLELANYCRENGIHIAINSYGLDFYIKALLSAYNVNWIPFYATETTVTSLETKFEYRFPREGCDGWGNCKCRIVEGYQSQGCKVVYAGDGMSDICPATRADFVFARATLLEFCKTNQLPHKPLVDFRDLIAHIKENNGSSEFVKRIQFD